MNPEQIKQIVETIKTLNININDTTTQKLAEVILPIVKLYLIKEYVNMTFGFITALVAIFAIYKTASLFKERKQG